MILIHVAVLNSGQVLDMIAAEGPGRAFAFAGSLDATLRTCATADTSRVVRAVDALGSAARTRGVFAGRLCGGKLNRWGVSCRAASPTTLHPIPY